MSTKKLAKELGLVRKRGGSSSRSKTKPVSNQIFSYLIVIDFESTCWREKNNCGQEIIEFPAVLLNTSTGEVQAEFHTYVQPQEHPTLSEFCTELTGITQTRVEAGSPLQICMSQFSRWLQNLQVNMGLVFPNHPQTSSASAAAQKLCTFLTWSDWDLGVCLQYECRRKQIHKPDVLNSWIDLRSTYRLFYDRKPKGLNGALQDLGIQFAGREHSGLDDARNTAQLAARMMRDGCVMKVTRSLTRAPPEVRHVFGNTAAGKRENTSPGQRDDALPTDRPPLSIFPPQSGQQGSRSGTRELDSAQGFIPTRQSLVSPKTLLSGAAATPGGGSLNARNRPSPPKNTSLVLCSTTVSCLFSADGLNQPPAEREAPGLAGEEVFSLETEERCGSYDDVVLDGNDDIIGGESGFYSADFDGGGCLWEESSNTASALDQLRETSKSVVLSLAATTVTPQVSRRNRGNETWQRPQIKRADPGFVVPKSVAQASRWNQLKTEVEISTKGQEKSNFLDRNSKTNTLLLSEKTSTPYSSLVRPKAAFSHFSRTPKSSFSIYTDPVRPSADSACTTKRVLASLSANVLSSRSYCSSKGQRVTSPLCSCGRRAKRQVVSNGGPNQGRGFYCCSVRRSGGAGQVQKGCEFFKWESAVMKGNPVASAAARSSVSLCQVNSSLGRRPGQKSSRKSC